MEAAFDKIYCAPLRMSEMKQLLEACTGHALEIRQALVSATTHTGLLAVTQMHATLAPGNSMTVATIHYNCF